MIKKDDYVKIIKSTGGRKPYLNQVGKVIHLNPNGWTTLKLEDGVPIKIKKQDLEKSAMVKISPIDRRLYLIDVDDPYALIGYTRSFDLYENLLEINIHYEQKLILQTDENINTDKNHTKCIKAIESLLDNLYKLVHDTIYRFRNKKYKNDFEPNIDYSTEKCLVSKTMIEELCSTYIIHNGKFQYTLPIHIKLHFLKFLFECGVGGSDTIPMYRNGPSIFTFIIKGFRGIPRMKALKMFIDYGCQADLVGWNIETKYENMEITKLERYQIIDMIHPYLTNPKNCVICMDSKLTYNLQCCGDILNHEGNDNRLCFECHRSVTTCPFCRSFRGRLMNPTHLNLRRVVFNLD
jgi:hypothetical protein